MKIDNLKKYFRKEEILAGIMGVEQSNTFVHDEGRAKTLHILRRDGTKMHHIALVWWSDEEVGEGWLDRLISRRADVESYHLSHKTLDMAKAVWDDMTKEVTNG